MKNQVINIFKGLFFILCGLMNFNLVGQQIYFEKPPILYSNDIDSSSLSTTLIEICYKLRSELLRNDLTNLTIVVPPTTLISSTEYEDYSPQFISFFSSKLLEYVFRSFAIDSNVKVGNGIFSAEILKKLKKFNQQINQIKLSESEFVSKAPISSESNLQLLLDDKSLNQVFEGAISENPDEVLLFSTIEKEPIGGKTILSLYLFSERLLYKVRFLTRENLEVHPESYNYWSLLEMPLEYKAQIGN